MPYLSSCQGDDARQAKGTQMAQFPCFKCDGKGKVHGFSHIANGVCFQCGGVGTLRVRGKIKPVGASPNYPTNADIVPENLRSTPRQWEVLESMGRVYAHKHNKDCVAMMGVWLANAGVTFYTDHDMCGMTQICVSKATARQALLIAKEALEA